MYIRMYVHDVITFTIAALHLTWLFSSYHIRTCIKFHIFLPCFVSGDVGWSAASCDAALSFALDAARFLLSDFSFLSNKLIWDCVSCKINQLLCHDYIVNNFKPFVCVLTACQRHSWFLEIIVFYVNPY